MALQIHGVIQEAQDVDHVEVCRVPDCARLGARRRKSERPGKFLAEPRAFLLLARLEAMPAA